MVDVAVISGLGGALLGGVSGAWLNHALSQPKPEIKISDINIAALQCPERLAEPAISEDIFKKKAKEFLLTPEEVSDVFKKHDFLKSPLPYYQHPQLYTLFLYQASRDNERVRLDHRVMPSAVKAMTNNFKTGLIEEMFRLFMEHNEIIWSHMAGEFKRGNFDIDDTDLGSDPQTPKHSIATDKDGDFYINFDRFRIGFLWSTERVQRDDLKGFANRAAKAFAYENESVIEQILGFLESVIWDNPILAKTEQMIDSELENYSRLVVTGVFVNSGRSPSSIVGTGKLRIDARGFKVGSGSNARTLKGDIDIAMHLVDGSFVRTTPSLQAPPGDIVPFMAVSEKYIREFSEREDILSLFGSERECQITFPVIGHSPSITSNKLKFQRP